jgi:hypothetical protein
MRFIYYSIHHYHYHLYIIFTLCVFLTGRRGGVKVLAPSSSRWLEAVASYGSAISPPPSNENATGGTAAAGVKLHRQQPAGAPAAASSESGGGSGSSGSSGRKGVVELVDSAPLQKYGVRLYTIAVSGYVQSQSDGADYQGGASFHFISFLFIFTQTILGPTQGNASFYPDRLRTTARKWRFHLGFFGFASSRGLRRLARAREDGESSGGEEHTYFLRHLYTKPIVSPRQARDKHRKNSKTASFSQQGMMEDDDVPRAVKSEL